MNLYLVKMGDDLNGESFFKVGITKYENVIDRFSYGKTKVIESNLPLRDILSKALAGEKYISDHPYKVEVIHSVWYSLEGNAMLAEQELLAALKPKQYWPKISFHGSSECFHGEGLCDFIINHMNEDSDDRNKSAPSELQYRVNAAFIKENDPIKKHQLVMMKCKE